MPNFVSMVNYFELYGLNISFHPDQDQVKKKFYELSRQFHPDKFAQAGSEAIDEALKMSAMINAGYKILKDEDAIVNYILKYHQVLEDEEKYNLSPDFLMEMMELNEAVSDYEMEQDDSTKDAAIRDWQTQASQLQGELNPLTEKYDSGDHSAQLLQQIKDCYFRKKYLLRIKERIAKFAAL